MAHHQDDNTARSDFFDRITPLIADGRSANHTTTGNSASTSSGPLQVKVPADVLAYIECTLGIEPKNSWVVVAFAHNQLATVVRCDLPESLQNMARCDTPESVTFMDFGMTEAQELEFIAIGRHVGELIAREPSTTSALLLYIAEDVTVSDQHALAVMGTGNAVIAAQFALQGVPVQESWLIHHNKLWHLRCSFTTECTVQGEDIQDPRTRPLYRALNPARSPYPDREATSRKLAFPPETTVAPEEAPDTQGLLAHRPQVVLQWLNLWDDHLRNGPTMLNSDEVAQLLAAVEHPPIRNALLATACFDISTAIRGLVGLKQFPAEIAALAELFGNMSDGTTVREGLEGESERPPDWQRIAQLEQLSRHLLPLSDQHSGGVLAGILVWIEWVRGRGSIAKDYLRQARQRFPDEQYLMILEEFLKQGPVAGWATRVESAWSPQHAA